MSNETRPGKALPSKSDSQLNMCNSEKISELKVEIQKLRNYIFVKGLQWDYASYFGDGKVGLKWDEESRNAEQLATNELPNKLATPIANSPATTDYPLQPFIQALEKVSLCSNCMVENHVALWEIYLAVKATRAVCKVCLSSCQSNCNCDCHPGSAVATNPNAQSETSPETGVRADADVSGANRPGSTARTVEQKTLQERHEGKGCTTEPWFVARQPWDHRCTAIYGAQKLSFPNHNPSDPHGGRLIADCDVTEEWEEGEPDGTVEDQANAERIVACVNACAGMKDPEREVPALRSRPDSSLSQRLLDAEGQSARRHKENGKLREMAADMASYLAAIQTGGAWSNEWCNRVLKPWNDYQRELSQHDNQQTQLKRQEEK